MAISDDSGGDGQARWWLRLWPPLLLCAPIAGFALGGAVGSPLGRSGLAVVGVGAILALARSRSRPGWALGVLMVTLLIAGWAWGTARAESTAPPHPLETGRASGLATLLEPPVATERGARARAKVERLTVSGRAVLPAGATVLLGLEPDRGELEEGARVRLRGALREAASASAPGWWTRWLVRNGVAARLEVERADVVGRRGGVWGLRDRWRTWARSHAGRGLSGDTGALVRGMLLGGGTELSERAQDEFRASGIWHLLAVSGQNVTVVAIAVLAALRAVFVPRRAALVAAGIAIAGYCLACEGGPSVARAGLMGALGLSVAVGGLPRRRWYLLLLSLAIVLGIRPRDVADPGLQLSFAAVAGLYTLAPSAADVLERYLPRRLAELLATSLGAGLATAPILAVHFGHLSLVGFALNVVAVPLAAPVVVLALVALAAEPLGPLARAPAELAGLGADALLLGARIAASAPAASVTVPRASAAALAVLAAAVWAAFAAMGRGWRPARPPRRAVVACALAGSAAVGAVWWFRPPAPVLERPAVVSVAILDVGQGQSVLVSDGSGARALVDVGPAGAPAPALDLLRRAGIGRVDQVLISHDAADHSGGLRQLLGEIEVGEVRAPTSAPEALAVARSRGVPTRSVAQGQALRVGRVELVVLWPPPGLEAQDPNDTSLVVEVGAPGLRVLVPGDAESPVLERVSLSAADALVVAHHGSADDGLGSVLDRLRPRLAVISVGSGNRHGHPAPSTIRTIESAGVSLARTDADGSVLLTP